MANNAAGAIVLIVVIFVAVVLFVPRIIPNIGGINFQGYSDQFWQWLNHISGRGSSNIAGQAWFAFTVHFSDGTTQDINMNPTLSLFPLSITFEGKTVTQLDLLIRAKLDEDNVGAWSAHASQHIEVYLKPETTPKTSSTGSFDTSGSSWTKGEIKTLISTQISGTTLDNLFKTYGSGDWLFQTTGYVNMTLRINYIPQITSATLNAGGIDLSENPSLSISTITGSNLQQFPLLLTP
jgi:hypothetical protein